MVPVQLKQQETTMEGLRSTIKMKMLRSNSTLQMACLLILSQLILTDLMIQKKKQLQLLSTELEMMMSNRGKWAFLTFGQETRQV